MNYEQQLQMLQKLRSQVNDIRQIVDSKTKSLTAKEAQIRQGQVPNTDARALEKNLQRNLGPMLSPGNVGDINKIIWPFYFSTEIPDSSLGQNETFQTGFSVTQEAAFILMGISKTVYAEANPGEYVYLDPNDSSNAANSAPGLQFTIRDGSSSRQFFNTPMEISHYGNPRFPTKLPRPIMFLPNQNVQIAFINTHATNLYLPRITVFGYRMRVEDAQNFLSLVYG